MADPVLSKPRGDTGDRDAGGTADVTYRVEQVFLIHRKTGLLLCHAAREGRDVAEPELVSAMLTAIHDFAQDTFGAEKARARQSFSVGELSVVVEAGRRCFLAAALRGRPDAGFPSRLGRTLDGIEDRFDEEIRRFSGDSGALAAAEPLLVERLETGRRLDSPSRSKMAVLIGALLVSGALVVPAAHRRWQDHRLATLVERLDDEPGMVVLEATRESGRWHVTGARDSLARPLAQLLDEAGVDPGDVDFVWREQQSADPEIVLARARTQLKPPPGVKLELRRSTLIAVGSAPPEWIAAAESSAETIFGVSSFDGSGVRPLAADPAQHMIEALESLVVRFSPGSPEPIAGQEEILGRAARLFSALEDRVKRRLEIVVALPPASDDFARKLGEARGDAVMARLRELGVPDGAVQISLRYGSEAAAGDAGGVASFLVEAAGSPSER